MLKCPKCGSTDIDEEGEIDYVDYNKKESVEYVYYLNKCRQCRHLFDKDLITKY